MKLNKQQISGVLMILAVAKDTMKDKYNKQLAEKLHREISLKRDEA